ncbi:MAG: hypothetical protein HKN76_13120, partial [Saprospiraceae bacterium]|nr:hypothetical protein [Saprospiraceae bacterium]
MFRIIEIRMRIYFVCCVWLMGMGCLIGQDSSPIIFQDDYQLNITRTARDVQVDGRLDEEIWQRADKATN